MTERLQIPLALRWGDLDAFNHVNNVTLMRLLEEARVRAFWRPEPGEEAPDTAVLSSGLEAGMLTLIAQHQVEYLAPIPYQRHPLMIEMWFSKLGGASAELSYEVYQSVEPRTFYARASTTMVLVDAETGRPTRVSDEVRDVWSRYLGEPIDFSKRVVR